MEWVEDVEILTPQKDKKELEHNIKEFIKALNEDGHTLIDIQYTMSSCINAEGSIVTLHGAAIFFR